MGPSTCYAACFTAPQLATSIKTAALKNQSKGGQEQEGEGKSNRSSNNSGFTVTYSQQQQSSYQQQHYCCPCCGRQQPCSGSKLPEKSSSHFEFDPMEQHQQHYNRRTHCSPSIGATENSQEDGSLGGSNDDCKTNIDSSQSLGNLYDQQGQNNQFSYQVQQQLSSQRGQELQISRGGGNAGSSESHQHLGYTTNYTQTDECWTLPPSSGHDHPVFRASQFSDPTFSSNQTTDSRNEQQQPQQVSCGYGFYSNYNNKIASFEDANDFNNNHQQLQQQNPVFSSSPVTLRPRMRRDSPYLYQQDNSTSTSRGQIYTTSSSFYSIASDCNQTSDYGARDQQQHFRQQDRSCNAQGHPPLQTVASSEAHHDQQQQLHQPTHNSIHIQSPNRQTDRSFQSIQQRLDCSNYGQIITQQQSNSHQTQLSQEHNDNPNSLSRTQSDNNQCYDNQHEHFSAHVQQHQLYKSQQQQTVTQNQVASNEQYSDLQQPTTNCDNYADQISATITSPIAINDGIRLPNHNKLRSLKGRRGRPRKKSTRSKNKVNGKLWEFIRDLLLNERTNPSFIRWERREDGVFKFVQSDKVAKMWGERKQNPKMTYEKLSRAMRYYYKSKVLLPVFGRRLVYKFGPNATGWMPETKDSVF